MRASGVVLDLNEKTNIACVYIRDFPQIQAYNTRKSIKGCSLNIQQFLKDKVPGKIQ